MRLACLLWLTIFSCTFLSANEAIFYNRISPGGLRYDTFLKTMQILEKRGAKVLVETGTSRGGFNSFGGDGGSTILFSHWASLHGAQFYSVDICPKNIFASAQATKAYANHVTYICADSVEFLTHFSQKIDFLYLDSYDFDANNPAPSQQHHLKEIQAAYPLLHAESVVLIDDCRLPHGGKGKLVIAYLMEKGWKIVAKDYQVLMVKK